eukprot:CAMPEP_0118708236 /NCGR_PEP_ID=MMETSP0800-20121206/21749_1 /TAXON_ID=210618 ORGANISM="Striatella unipunctata, Strain CCMP2910" /NCGR_SAMPLE_ID=MMETSP0800 /ASSEMBLY_ACC=CAM_ASM_000638 /LENGTH=333 /DNA_ID=CAMNT_0006611355 /DNA_START=8 /DNA_END=1009 /DNA_ORIENTATION=-
MSFESYNDCLDDIVPPNVVLSTGEQSTPVPNPRSTSKKTPKKKTWKKPKDKPKRPLSAYNLFFQHERERILYENGVSEEEKSKNEDCRRNHKKSHGKIGFAALARNVAEKWKKLDASAKAVFEEQAAVEKQRYKMEIEQWNQGRRAKVLADFASSMQNTAQSSMLLPFNLGNQYDLPIQPQQQSFQNNQFSQFPNLDYNLTGLGSLGLQSSQFGNDINSQFGTDTALSMPLNGIGPLGTQQGNQFVNNGGMASLGPNNLFGNEGTLSLNIGDGSCSNNNNNHLYFGNNMAASIQSMQLFSGAQQRKDPANASFNELLTKLDDDCIDFLSQIRK